MRGRILRNEYIKETGYTIVEKATQYGSFIGEAQVHPHDKDIATAWDGYNFAEMKCDIAAAKEKAKWMRQRAIGAEHALKTLDYMGTNDPETLDNLARQVYAMHKEADKYKEIYEEMRDSYPAYTQVILDRRRQLREKVQNN